MDWVTAGLNAYTAWLNWQTTLVSAMTPAQRATYLEPQITVLLAIAQDFMALNKQLVALAHPGIVVTPTPAAHS